MYSVREWRATYNIQFTFYSLECIMHCIINTVPCVQCERVEGGALPELYNVLCTLYSVQCTVQCERVEGGALQSTPELSARRRSEPLAL